MSIYILILFIFIYSFFGYIYETAINIVNKVPINTKGFLYGPVRPIYGFGCALIIIVFYDTHIDTLPLFFLVGLLACTLEYFTSYLLEKIFNKHYWDYSDNLFNINGRVCLLGFTVFGLFGVILVNFIHPNLVELVYDNLSNRSIIYAVYTLIGIFIIDILMSLYHLYH